MGSANFTLFTLLAFFFLLPVGYIDSLRLFPCRSQFLKRKFPGQFDEIRLSRIEEEELNVKSSDGRTLK